MKKGERKHEALPPSLNGVHHFTSLRRADHEKNHRLSEYLRELNSDVQRSVWPIFSPHNYLKLAYTPMVLLDVGWD